eukprot:TRINITY_DN27377_c0_g1_i1.p1 TRINITY_DN27377_c0_g1~~TRINITY_DN27377_c0_g1_i1.p1  ORF type:complete len:127 (+),score=58.19 TRINITY_DN27377_c0_g1_i1:47-427(+)
MPASKAADVKSAAKDKKVKGRRVKKDYSSYSHYIHKLLKGKKNKEGKVRITGKGMAIMNSMISDLFDRLATESGRLAKHAKMTTLNSRAIIAAVKLHYPTELARHALSAGAAAVATYDKTTKAKKK